MENQFDVKEFRMILGRKIRMLRKSKGITQMELAKELGFSSSGTISQVENGLKGLKVESIMKAAIALEVHPIVLMTPYEMKQDDIERVSALFKLFEKRSKQPNIFSRYIQKIRNILLLDIHDRD
jgi:transcriptional regulator with XRE-family HTH domain